MKPDFIIAGMPKCGTTSIYYYLQQHPGICMSSMKEPHFYSDFSWDYQGYKDKEYFFGKKSIFTQLQYDNLYCTCKKNTLKGEASTNSLYLNTVYPEQVKLIIGLRNPIDRAYSHYLQMRRLKRERLPFLKALIKEDSRIRGGYSPPWHYANMGFYYDQLLKIKHLPHFLFFFEEFQKNPNLVLSKIVEFLELPDYIFNTDKIYNKKTKEPFNKLLYRYLPGRLQNKGLVDPPNISVSEKEYLQKLYKIESLKMKKMLGDSMPDNWYC